MRTSTFAEEAVMKFCGIDLHSNNSVVVVTDETDRVLVSRRCPNELVVARRMKNRHGDINNIRAILENL